MWIELRSWAWRYRLFPNAGHSSHTSSVAKFRSSFGGHDRTTWGQLRKMQVANRRIILTGAGMMRILGWNAFEFILKEGSVYTKLHLHSQIGFSMLDRALRRGNTLTSRRAGRLLVRRRELGKSPRNARDRQRRNGRHC